VQDLPFSTRRGSDGHGTTHRIETAPFCSIFGTWSLPRLAKDSHRKAATVRFFRPEQGYAHDVLVLLAVSQYIRNLGAYCELHIKLIAQILHLVYLLQG